MVNSESNGGPKNEDNPQYCKLFVGGVAYTTTDDQLRDFYSQFGEVTDSIVMRDSATGRSRGFGFVTYKNMTQVDNAMNNRPHVIESKTVDPKRAMPREISIKSESNVSTTKLYVNGIDQLSEDDLREYFATFGTVAQVEIKSDKTNPNRKYAFVTFEDHDPVDKCMLTGPHELNGRRCDVQKSLGKEEQRRAQQMDRDRQNRDGRSRGMGRGGGGGDYNRRGTGGDYRRGGGGGGGYGGRGGGGGYGGRGGGGGGYGGGGGGGGWDQGGGWNQQSAGGGWSQGGGGGSWNQSGGWEQGGGGGGYGGGYDQAPQSQQGGGWSGGGATQGWGGGPPAAAGGASGGGWSQGGGGGGYAPQTTAYPQQQGWSQQPASAATGGWSQAPAGGGQQWSQPAAGGGRGY